MDISLSLLLLLVVVAFVCEFIDSSLGMMYGTILSPVLIIAGFSPATVIPALLFSQAVGGLIATWRHHKFDNAKFHVKSEDFRIAFVIFMLGIVAVIFGAFVGVNLPKIWLKTYIGVLVLVMGALVLVGKSFKFSWKKVMGIGVLSSFNKALSGGGFGPVVASGLILSGREGKNAIGATDFAEAPICIMAFLAWAILNKTLPNIPFLTALTIGAAFGGFIGPVALSKVKSKRKLIVALGILTVVLGVWTLIKTHLV